MTEANEIGVIVAPHVGTKCPRCWHRNHLQHTHAGLCDRCQDEIVAGWPDHEDVPHIKAAQQAERKRWCVRPDGDPCPHKRCCRGSA